MATEDYSKNGLLTYLRESAVTGVLNPAVAKSRNIAAEHLLNFVTPEERMDLQLLDVDDLCSRIFKLEDSSIRVEALELYNSRLKSALNDYFQWVKDPQNFVSLSGTKPTIQTKASINKHETKALEEITLSNSNSESGILPIQLRKDLTVFIKDLPLDLTAKEAKKMVDIINAFVTGEE